MIFHKGAYEKTQLFYKINNKSSRKHFIEQIKLEIEKVLFYYIYFLKLLFIISAYP